MNILNQSIEKQKKELEHKLQLEFVQKEKQITLDFIRRKTNLEAIHRIQISEFGLNLERRKGEEKEAAKQKRESEFKEYLCTFRAEEMHNYNTELSKYKMPRLRYAQLASVVCFTHHSLVLICLLVLYGIDPSLMEHWPKLLLADSQIIAESSFFILLTINIFLGLFSSSVIYNTFSLDDTVL